MMLRKLGLLTAAALCAVTAFATTADAGERWKFRYYAYDPDYDFYYGPEYVPQPRYYRYMRRQRQDYLYDDDDEDSYDPDYYQPEYVPRRKRQSYAKPRMEQAPQTQEIKKKPTAITCAKAGEIVSGYGFKSVEQVSCKGQTYAFNATRDGKPFSIKLSAASGELTEVKKRQ
jgi:hypothetical protein